MYSFIFATRNIVLGAAQFSGLTASKLYATKLSAQFAAHVIAYGCTEAEYRLAESIMANKTSDTDMAQFKPATKPSIRIRDQMVAEAIQRIEPAAEPCMKCGGSGTYQWGWDGKAFRFSGKCFDCKGKGHMDTADAKRDAYYHNHIERLDFAH